MKVSFPRYSYYSYYSTLVLSLSIIALSTLTLTKIQTTNASASVYKLTLLRGGSSIPYSLSGIPISNNKSDVNVTESLTDEHNNNNNNNNDNVDYNMEWFKNSMKIALKEKSEQIKDYLKWSKNSTLFQRRTNETDRRTILDRDALKRVYHKLVAVVKLYDNSTNVDEDSSKGSYASKSDPYDLVRYSDLSQPNRTICIVTTASIPWMTGTSVNPLLRAAYLYRKNKEIQQETLKKEINNDYVDSNDDGDDSDMKDTLKSSVTLVVPWLDLEEDRVALYGKKFDFQDQKEQELYIREWLRAEAKLPDAADGLRILFYPARYHSSLGSIFAMGDIASLIPDNYADVCILEEPEHLNWYRAPGESWTNKFNYVVGIAHTNYKEYASGHYSGLWTAPAIGFMSSAMVRAYCHKVIKLSAVLQTFAIEKETIANVHGVRSEFIDEGTRRRENAENGETIARVDELSSPTNVYFIGKLLWAKGFDQLLELQAFYKRCTGSYFAIDIYGSGPDEIEIENAFQGRSSLIRKGAPDGQSIPNEMGNDLSNDVQASILSKISETWKSYDLELPKSFHQFRRDSVPAKFGFGRVDHALLKQYKIFVNPSVSEVLCTTTAEALAMGKFVIVPVHPSNSFFMKFPNCLCYRNNLEFAANLRWALSREPEPLSAELSHELTWEAATERFMEEAKIGEPEAFIRLKIGRSKLDDRIAWFHNELGSGVKGDAIRKVLGAGPISNQVRYEMTKQLNELEEVSDEEDIS